MQFLWINYASWQTAIMLTNHEKDQKCCPSMKEIGLIEEYYIYVCVCVCEHCKQQLHFIFLKLFCLWSVFITVRWHFFILFYFIFWEFMNRDFHHPIWCKVDLNATGFGDLFSRLMHVSSDYIACARWNWNARPSLTATLL